MVHAILKCSRCSTLSVMRWLSIPLLFEKNIQQVTASLSSTFFNKILSKPKMLLQPIYSSLLTKLNRIQSYRAYTSLVLITTPMSILFFARRMKSVDDILLLYFVIHYSWSHLSWGQSRRRRVWFALTFGVNRRLMMRPD